MADIREDLRRSFEEEARQRELRRRRESFIRRMQERPISRPPKGDDDSGLIDRLTPDIVELAAGQIAQTIKDTPRGLYELGRAGVLDVRDLARGDFTPERVAGLGLAMAKGIKQTWSDPLDNPGYALLDLISVASLGAGTVTRGIQAGKAAAAVRRGELPPEPGGRRALPHGGKPPSEGGYGGKGGVEKKAEDPDWEYFEITDPDRIKEWEDASPSERKAKFGGKVPTKMERLPKHPGVITFRTQVLDPALNTREHRSIPLDTEGTMLSIGIDNRTGAARLYIIPYGDQSLRKPVSDWQPTRTRQAQVALGKLAQTEAFDWVRGQGQFADRPFDITWDKSGEVAFVRTSRGEIAMDKEELLQLPYMHKSDREKASQRTQLVTKARDVNTIKKWLVRRGGNPTLARLMAEFGVDKEGAKEMQQLLRDEGVLTKGGKVRKKQLQAKATPMILEPGEGVGPLEKVIDKGEIDIAEIKGYMHPDDLADPTNPEVVDIAERMKKGEEFDPIELRVDPDMGPYVEDGLKRLAAAELAGREQIAFKTVEQTPEPEVPATVPKEKSTPRDKRTDEDLEAEAFNILREAKGPMSLAQMMTELKLYPTQANQTKTRKIMQKLFAERNREAERTGARVKPIEPEQPPIQRKKRLDWAQARAGAAVAYNEYGPNVEKVAEHVGVTKESAKKLIEDIEAQRAAAKQRSYPEFETRERVKATQELWDLGKKPSIAEIARTMEVPKAQAKKILERATKERAQYVIARERDARLEKLTEKARPISPPKGGEPIRKSSTKRKVSEAELNVARAKVERVWHEHLLAEGKPMSAAAVQRLTGLPREKAKAVHEEVARKKGTEVPKRETLRGKGTSDRDLHINKRALEAAGVPAEFHSEIRRYLRPVLLTKNPKKTELMFGFQKALGDAAGKEAFRRWMAPKGGSGELPSPGRAALQAFLRRPQGGSYLLAIAERNRRTGEVSKVMLRGRDEQELEAPLEQRKTIERTTVEVPLSDNPILKAFQQHRYKWMAKETSYRIANTYKKLIFASNKQRNPAVRSQVQRHIDFQLRELDRAADAIQNGKFIPLTNRGFTKRVVLAYQTRGEGFDQRRLEGGSLGQYVDTANQMAIIGTLFLKPAYLLANLIGQGFLVTADHFLNPLQLHRSMQQHRALFAEGADEAAQRVAMNIRSAMHEGMIESIDVPVGRSKKVSQLHHSMATMYSQIMDNWFREVSFLREARRHGFETPEDLFRLFTDEGLQGQVTQISRRANKNIIDFGNMNEWDKKALRRIIFFYPWIKASTLYTARFPTQHPAQALAIERATQEGTERAERELGPLPSYLEGTVRGPDIDVPFFGNLGKRTLPDGTEVPRLINPAAASIFGSAGEVLAAARALALGDVRESEQAGDFISPAIGIGISTILRRDPFTGKEYPQGTSMFDIAKQEASQYVAPVDMIMDIRKMSEGDPSERLHPYTAGERIARYVGGITPYSVNPKEARSRAFAERRALADKQQREYMKYDQKRADLLKAAKETGVLAAGEKRLPKEVRDAYNLRAQREANLVAFEQEIGRDLTPADRLYADVNLAVRMGKIPESFANSLLRSLETLPDSMVEAIGRSIRESHFGVQVISDYRKMINERLELQGREKVSG